MKANPKRRQLSQPIHVKRCSPTPAQVDEAMARRGYDVGWHGTVGRWTTPIFGCPHGVEAFYLAVERGVAESYAALRSLFLDEKPRVMKFYVALRNVLVLQDDGGGAKAFEKVLANAKERGYDVVKLLGAFDDQHYRLGNHGEIIRPTCEDVPDEAGPADIWVVLNPVALVSPLKARRMLAGHGGLPSKRKAVVGRIFRTDAKVGA